MILTGLKTCDTCRRALRELTAAGHSPRLRDPRAEPLPPEEIAALLDRFGPALINRRSTTWRNLPEAERTGDPAALLARHPALMKRPLVQDGARATLGWDAAARAEWGA